MTLTLKQKAQMAGLLVALMASPCSFGDMNGKLEMHYSYPIAPPGVEKESTLVEIFYVQGSARRKDQGGKIGTRSAVIRDCDSGKGYSVDLDRKEYWELRPLRESNYDYLRDLYHGTSRSPSAKTPSVIVRSLTLESGEPRVLFGRAAHHFVTTAKEFLGDSEKVLHADETIEGWYWPGVRPFSEACMPADLAAQPFAWIGEPDPIADRHEQIEDPAHRQALLEQKRKALGSTASGRLAALVPESQGFLQAAFERGESAARLTAQLLRLLDDYGVAEFTAALREALRQQTPRLSSVAFILARRHRQRRQRTPLAVNLARRPDLEHLTVSNPSLEAYDDLTQDPRKIPTPSSDLVAQLKQLGLVLTADSLDDLVARAATGRWSPRQLLEEIARSESEAAARRSLERRLALAKLDRFKPLAEFEWNWPKKIDRPLIERALTLDFLTRGRNLILCGTAGLGKTMIAKNIAHAAILAGHTALFRTVSDLLADLDRDSPAARRRKFRFYARPTLLVLDEVGYLAYDAHAADLLFEIVNHRYERNSVVLTTKAYRRPDAIPLGVGCASVAFVHSTTSFSSTPANARQTSTHSVPIECPERS